MSCATPLCNLLLSNGQIKDSGQNMIIEYEKQSMGLVGLLQRIEGAPADSQRGVLQHIMQQTWSGPIAHHQGSHSAI
jgi:hypothetical protein